MSSVVFRCGERLLAVPLDSVQEVFRMVAVSARLPRAPRTCLGVVDCRGRLVPLFDLGARLGVTPPRDELALVDAHVVLVNDSVGTVGYVVDEVRELVEQAPEPVVASGSSAIGRLTIGAVRCSDGKLAPLVEQGALLTVAARHMLRASLEALAEGAP
jgi:purine-binding chemotaxis protein CheW